MSTRVGESSRAAGISWVTSGSASTANERSREKVRRDSSRNVGKALKIAIRSWSRLAVVCRTVFELSIRLRSWPRRRLRASKVVAPLANSWRTATSCVLRVRKILSKPEKVGARSANELERLGARPSIAVAESRSHVRSAARVLGSKVRRISSSSTVGATCAALRVAPSASFGPSSVPGVISM